MISAAISVSSSRGRSLSRWRGEATEFLWTFVPPFLNYYYFLYYSCTIPNKSVFTCMRPPSMRVTVPLLLLLALTVGFEMPLQLTGFRMLLRVCTLVPMTNLSCGGSSLDSCSRFLAVSNRVVVSNRAMISFSRMRKTFSSSNFLFYCMRRAFNSSISSNTDSRLIRFLIRNDSIVFSLKQC